MRVVYKITRFDPTKDREPYPQVYEVEVQPHERVLDGLIYIKNNLDGSLAFRKSCAHGVCGSDAMRINGVERLACKTLVREVAHQEGDLVTVEPLRHLPVERDLMVDQGAFFAKYRDVKPFFIAATPTPVSKERIQSPGERQVYDDPTACILCACCVSACPVMDKNPDFIGPAAIVQAARFNFDSRDGGFDERAQVLNTPNGVWACENHYECTRVCPRGIKVTKAINLTKRLIQKRIPGSGPADKAAT